MVLMDFQEFCTKYNKHLRITHISNKHLYFIDSIINYVSLIQRNVSNIIKIYHAQLNMPF